LEDYRREIQRRLFGQRAAVRPARERPCRSADIPSPTHSSIAERPPAHAATQARPQSRRGG
jgi:hypothetical protein